ncbi:7067_t:CDS:2, partial [Cetraspora pellucida]
NLNKEKQVQNVDDKIPDERAASFSSDCEVVQRGAQANFEANFGRMSVDVLRFLCHELGISEAGSKQDLVNRLVSESKRREGSAEANVDKGKVPFAGEGTTAAMFGSAGASFFEPGAGAASNPFEARPDERAFGSNTLGIDQSQQAYWSPNKRPRVAQDQGFSRNEPQDKHKVQVPFFQGVQPVLPTLVQPQPYVQPMWHQSPFQSMSSGPVGFGGQWNGSGSPSWNNPNFSDQQVPLESLSRNSVHSSQSQPNLAKFQSSASFSSGNGKIGKMQCDSCPSSYTTILAFVAWMEMAGRSSEIGG